MHRFGLLAPFALALGLAAAVPKEASTSAPVAPAPAIPATASPEIALLLTAPEGDFTELVFQRGHETSTTPETVARFEHRPGGMVRGAVLPRTRAVVAIADVARDKDWSWGASLIRLDEGQPPKQLVDRVYTSTRPLVLEDGTVLVQRGYAGEEPSEEESLRGRLRVDEITIDAIDPATGEARTLHAFSGYLAFLAGALGDEAFVYRVAPDHADIVAVHTRSGAVRAIASKILPFARDFSVDKETRSLVFAQRDARSSQSWVVKHIDLESLAETEVARGRRMALVPHVWPGGAIAFNPEGEAGLSLRLPIGRTRSLRPLGDGVDVVRGFSGDGRFALLVHTRPSELPRPYVWSLENERAERLAVPEGMRVDVAGVIE